MKQFILIVFLIHAGLSSAQDRFFYLGQPYIYKDSVLLDQSRLNLIYRHEFRVDTSASPMWSNVKMQVGRKVVKQTDLHVYFTNLWRKNLGGDSRHRAGSRAGGVDIERELQSSIFCRNDDVPIRERTTDYVLQLPSGKPLRSVCL